MEKIKDDDIIKLYHARDERAIEMTRQVYGQGLLRLAGRFLSKEDAEECLNDTFLSAWNRIPPDHPVYFSAWLAKICRNAALNRIRRDRAQKRSAERIAFDGEIEECIPDEKAMDEIGVRETGQLISAYLRGQPELRRRLFLRRYWYGDPVAELAERYSMSESNVKTTLYRMRGGLREYLSKEGVGV